MASFFTYFTSGFGTLILVALLLSLFSGERIDAGAFGLIGFFFLAFTYAMIRKVGGKTIVIDPANLRDVLEHPRYADFLAEDPERKYIYKEDLQEKFYDWLTAIESREPTDEDDAEGRVGLAGAT